MVKWSLGVLVGVAALGCLGLGVLIGLSELKLRDYTPVSPFQGEIPTNAAAITEGRRLARTRGCIGCHGDNLGGRDFSDDWQGMGRPIAANLTHYVRQHDLATIERAVRHGVDSQGRAIMNMPAYNFRRLSDEDFLKIVAFLKSMPVVETPLPAPYLGLSARYELLRGRRPHMAQIAQDVPELTRQDGDPVLALGEYIAMTTCNECHGLDVRGAAEPGWTTPDLAMTASYSDEDFDTLLNTGIGVGGRELGLMTLVARDRFPSLIQEERAALRAYLVSLAGEPVPEDVPWRVYD